jgi:hypothetical protein
MVQFCHILGVPFAVTCLDTGHCWLPLHLVAPESAKNRFQTLPLAVGYVGRNKRSKSEVSLPKIVLHLLLCLYQKPLQA